MKPDLKVLSILFLLFSGNPSFSQHQHGTNNDSAREVKQFTAGKTRVEIAISTYPLEKGKNCVFLVKVLDQETSAPINDVKVAIHIQTKNKDATIHEEPLPADYDQEKAIFVAEYRPAFSGKYEISLLIQGGSLKEPLTFSFSENVREQENMIEKVIHKGMEMHDKMHKNWLLLVAGAVLMVAIHGIK